MAKYRLVYSEPYEFDDDSPSGIGDHDIAWSDAQVEFEAEDDEQARRMTEKTTEQKIEILGESFHFRPIELVKIVQVW